MWFLTTPLPDGFDRGYDGSSPGGLKSDAYFPIEIDGERKPFVINGTNYSPEKRIPISFKLHTPGRIKILVPEEINKPYGNVYLYDHKEDTYLELSSDNHDGVAFGLPAGKYDDRYYLVFQKDDVETLPWPKADFEQFKSNV